MRILYPFSGDIVGGRHLSTLALIENLDRKRFEPVVAFHDVDGALKTLLESHEDASQIPVPRSFLDLILHPVRSINAIRAAKAFLVEREISLVQCDDGPLRHVWLYAAKAAHIPYVHYQQALANPTMEKTMSYPRFDALISNSGAVKDTLSFVSNQRYQNVIYPVVDLAYEPEDKRKNRKACLLAMGLADSDVRLVGYVGDTRKQKRARVFVEMAAQLKADGLGTVHFVMIGAGLETELGTLVQKKELGGDIFFAGLQEDASQWISALDVLVAPAVGGSFGRTLVEAMGLGTPVVAANVGGHRDSIVQGRTGILVEPDRADLFAAQVMELLADRALYDKMVERALIYSYEKFSPKKSVQAFETIYANLVRQR